MKTVTKDNRSEIARRITDRHYNAIGSIPPLPLWKVVDDELASLVAALEGSAAMLLRCEAAIFALIKSGRENLSAGHIKELDALRHAAKDLALEKARTALNAAKL